MACGLMEIGGALIIVADDGMAQEGLATKCHSAQKI